jgi:pSer/pThr/pTyr-binding forkhead associated (FHA) protein
MNNAHVKLSVLVSSPGKNETFSLEGEEFIFGRNSASTIHLNDPAFSRSHFKLVVENNSIILQDMGSSNGTFINGVQSGADKRDAILEGDIITVDNSDIKITIVSIISGASTISPIKTDIVPSLDVSEESFGIDHLSQEIIKEANLRVEEILKTAHDDAQAILIDAQKKSDKLIAEKQSHADHYIEKQVVEKKTALKKDLELEKSKKLEEINELFEADRKKLYEVLESKAKAIEKDHEKRRVDLNNELKIQIDNIQAKKIEFTELDNVFKEEVEKKKEELEKQIAKQKQELSILTADHEEEKKKQLQLMEAQFENKKFQLKEELDAVELKVLTAQKEFSSLYENYNTQKEAQVKTLEGLMAQKEQVTLELKNLSESLANQKISNAKYSTVTKNGIETLHSEISKIQKDKAEIESTLTISKKSLSDLQLNIGETQAEAQKLESTLKEQRQMIQNADVEMKKILAEKDEVLSNLAPLKLELNELMKKNDAAGRQNSELRAEHAKEVTALKSNFLQMKKDLEEEMRKHKTAEEERLQNLTRHELNQINKIKEDSLRIVLDLEDSITKELSDSTSKVFATTIGMTKFREIAPDFEKSIRTSLQSGVLKLLKNELSPADPLKKKNLSSTQKSWKPMAVGLSIGAIVFGGLPLTYQYVKDQNDPIRLQMEADARAAAAPPVRVFTPEKTNKLGASLVDSVIYTDHYYETVTQEKFRSGLMKEGSVYMYKQWNIDEEKSIQSYSMILSLIDVLHEKSEKIDPDYEKRDISKMSVIEKDTMKKLEKILGNEVRLEAALKFQNRYYDDYVMNVISENKKN